MSSAMYPCRRPAPSCCLRSSASATSAAPPSSPAIWHSTNGPAGHRTSQSATVSDRLVDPVRITDPRHALFGQRFDLSPVSEPRSGWVSVLLADGRRRWLPRTATDLDLACETMPNHALPRVSVRTLLPLARYVEALLCNSSKTADGAPPSDDRADFGSGSWGRATGAGAEAVAEDDSGATTRSGTADLPLAAIEAGGPAA